jgi:hypothetical protein
MVTQDTKQTAKNLLDKLLTLSNDGSPVNVDTGQVRPRNDSVILIVSLSAEADIRALETIRDELAADLVDLNVEPDVETAIQNIRISGGTGD